MTRKCIHCGVEFEATRPSHHACSLRCKRRFQEKRRRRRKRMENPSDPTTFLRGKVPDPPEREGVPFPLTQRLSGSFEQGKRK